MPAKLDETTGNYTTAQSSTYMPSNYVELPQSNTSTLQEASNIDQFEMWLDSPGQSTGESVAKAGVGILYGIINEPVKLVTGQTIGGEMITPSQRMDAFVNTVPGAVLKGVQATAVTKTAAGKNAFGSFLKQEKRVANADASKAYQANKKTAEAVKAGGKATDATNNAAEAAKKVKDDEEKRK